MCFVLQTLVNGTNIPLAHPVPQACPNPSVEMKRAIDGLVHNNSGTIRGERTS